MQNFYEKLINLWKTQSIKKTNIKSKSNKVFDINRIYFFMIDTILFKIATDKSVVTVTKLVTRLSENVNK